MKRIPYLFVVFCALLGAFSVNASGQTATPDANLDFDGDGSTDYAQIRVISGTQFWFTYVSGVRSAVAFGLPSDTIVPEDYDGDGKDDIAVYRAGAQSFFYILQSSNNTLRSEPFGITGDDPKVVADYDGDNRADIAVYRKSAGQNFYYYLASTSGNLVSAAWGAGTTTRPNVGDYDGDNKADLCVHYDGGSGAGIFAIQKSSGGNEFVPFGLISDTLAPGDYDGDRKNDFTVIRNQGGALFWYTLRRTNVFVWSSYGYTVDIPVPGDYDGDGKQDKGIWRPNNGGGQSVYFVQPSSLTNSLLTFNFGVPSDSPGANWYVH